jgi:hypothetical protein
MHLKFKKLWLILGLGSVGLVLFFARGNEGRPCISLLLADVVVFAQIHRSTTARYRLAITLCLMGIGLEYVQGLTDYRGLNTQTCP